MGRNRRKIKQIVKSANIAEVDDEDDDFVYNIERETGMKFLTGGDDGGPEGKIVIGRVLVEGDPIEGDFLDKTFPVAEEIEKIEKVRSKVENPSEIKIYIGTSMG